jgi:hypothetical protein
VPPDSKGSAFGHFERLEDTVSNDQAVVHSSNSGLLWIVVKAAVQPDSELPGQAWQS